MSDEKNVRIGAAAKEFNVGWQHIVEYLVGKGFKVENKPNTMLTQEMYNLLSKEYNKDKGLKEKADAVNIGIARKTDKPEEVFIEEKPKKEEPEIKEIIPEKKEIVLEKIEETPIVPDPAIKEEIEVKETEIIKIETKKTEIVKPKIVGKIDLERKKKPLEEPKPIDKEEITNPIVEEVIPEIVKPVESIIEEKKEEKAPIEMEMIETKRVTLEGPKIMGKIELKEEKKPEKKPAIRIETEEERKRKRKRIKKGERINLEKVKEDQKQVDRNVNRNRPIQPFIQPERKTNVVDPDAQEKIIQEQIRNTLAKLSGGKGKQFKSKFKKTKKEEFSQQENTNQNNVLQVAEFTSLSELAILMNVSATELVQKCFDLGMMVSINQRLDAEILELLGGEFGHKVSFIGATSDTDEVIEEEISDPETLEYRPPIVTIMGHVDHGKTSLLDYIREANVVAGEKGGITQHIGAYDVTLTNGKTIAFLDTPGHEAFTAMRARGAKLTDIAVIVIAADDQVMPQTKEAISHAQAAGVPMVFAINKIDRNTANPEKIKEQLSQMNILVEDWGGKYQSQEISAKTGLNVDTLLEKVLLEAELLDLKANPKKEAVGTIIEALLDKGRGYISNLMVQEGTLEVGDMIVSGPHFGRVKAMFNERNHKIINAGPSTPVLVLGLNGAPQAGEKFKVYKDEDEAKAVANKRMQILREQGIRTKKHITLEEIGRRKALGTFRELNIIIKADVDGSAEALTDSLLKLSTGEVQVNVIFKGVGQITETDVMLASASDAILIGFQVRPSTSVRKLSEKEGVEIRLYSIIYNAIEEVKAAMEGLLAPKTEEKITCTVEIREVFKISKVGTIAGCYVQEGRITRNTKIRLLRNGIVLHSGNLASLKRYKDDVKEVTTGMECGLNLNHFNDIEIGDILEGYEEVEVKRSL